MKNLFFLYLIVFTVASHAQEIFNGKDLNNFIQLNGTAEYRVEDGAIVGVSKSGVPNSFLATKQKYKNFILEFDVWVDYGLNSGVQIRSLMDPNYHSGRVHGYQVEIDTSPRRWSGGIYDEFRRGWIYPMSIHPGGREAFITGTWNHYRIEAIGAQIRTWINDIPCANLVDDMTDEGFIAFQVHAIYNKEDEGKLIKWKNITLTEVKDEYKISNSTAPEESYLNQTLTKDEINKGWKLLWDGQTLNGWKSTGSAGLAGSGWTINDGTLMVNKSMKKHGTDLITAREYGDFELVLDFKLTEGANSGIKYLVTQHDSLHYTGLEYQLIDNRKHPDAKAGVSGNRSLGSLYDLIPADNLSEPGNPSLRFKGVDQWNRARILCKNGHVEHWLNGVKIVEYDRHNQMMGALIDKSKYEPLVGFGLDARGHLLLQDHEDEVWFRNIKIREL